MARILLIDDDVAVRTMLRLVLEYHGHTVIEACNGQEGLRLFPRVNVDLLITDLVMPDKDGLEILLELRANRSRVKVIAISGGVLGNKTDYLRIAAHLGADKVFAKPFANEELLQGIDELLAASDAPTQR